MNLTLKTKGAAPALATTVEFDQKKVADALEHEISGYPASLEKATKLTQEFIDQHNITAVYASGTFMNFKISDEAVDAFDSL
jgi:hypothetical protein